MFFSQWWALIFEFLVQIVYLAIWYVKITNYIFILFARPALRWELTKYTVLIDVVKMERNGMKLWSWCVCVFCSRNGYLCSFDTIYFKSLKKQIKSKIITSSQPADYLNTKSNNFFVIYNEWRLCCNLFIWLPTYLKVNPTYCTSLRGSGHN